jgi:hypothetical protein
LNCHTNEAGESGAAVGDGTASRRTAMVNLRFQISEDKEDEEENEEEGEDDTALNLK